MPESQQLSSELERYRQSYVDLFGTMPPMPGARFAFTGSIDPEGLALAESLRAHAYHNDVFDEKTTQVLIFALLVAQGNPAAKWHAISARRAGATWQELQMAVSITAAAMSLGPANLGGSVLSEVFNAETT